MYEQQGHISPPSYTDQKCQGQILILSRPAPEPVYMTPTPNQFPEYVTF